MANNTVPQGPSGVRCFDNISWKRACKSGDPEQDYWYTTGAPHLAIAMQRRYGLTVVMLVDREVQQEYPEGYFPAIYHVFAMDTEGAVWDAKGRSTAEVLLADFRGVQQPGFLEASDQDLIDRYMGNQRPFPMYEEALVVKALQFMARKYKI